MKFKARVTAELRPDIADPQGQTIERTLPDLGVTNVERVRVGRQFVLTIDADSEESANDQVGKLCETLLTNPILETFTVDLQPA